MLSKSDFKAYLDCPCALWLTKQRPDLLPKDFRAELEPIFEQGRLVDIEAKKLFPQGVEVEGFVREGWENTQRLLKEKHDVLFQPTAIFGEIHSRGDILVRNGKAWDLLEVKSSTQVHDEHIPDVAFQRQCFLGAKIPLNKTYVVHVNNTYVRQGALDLKKLFTKEDVTAEVEAATALVKKQIPKALEVASWGKKPDEKQVHACVDNATCEYLGYYLKELPATLRKKLETLRHQDPLPNPPVVEIDAQGIRAELADLKYPIQYLDYETYSPAIPMFDGYRPYQRVTFQYSLHIQDTPKAKPRHEFYLEDKPIDPTDALAAHLKAHTANGGTFIAWNAGFEKGCNREMGERAPKFAAFFEKVNDRMFDPMLLFKKKRGLYFHSGFEGSASLKKVLPAIIPELSYKTLEIQEGGTASASWPTLTDPKTPAKEKEKLHKDMLDYCAMDTMAMVKIIEHLQKVSE